MQQNNGWEFNEAAAMDADKEMGGGISKGGVYDFIIDKAYRTQRTTTYQGKQNTVQSIEFQLKYEGSDFPMTVSIDTHSTNKGGRMWSAAKIDALIGLLQTNISFVDGTVERFGTQERVGIINELAGKPIKAAVRKIEYMNKKNEKKYRFELVHWFHPQSAQTFSEAKEQRQAQEYLKEIVDELLPEGQGNQGGGFQQQSFDAPGGGNSFGNPGGQQQGGGGFGAPAHTDNDQPSWMNG